jgi:hypothetical protein
MKLSKLRFGDRIDVDLTKLNEDACVYIKSLMGLIKESIGKDDKIIRMVAMAPTIKGMEVAPTKELGAMGHKIEVPHSAVVLEPETSNDLEDISQDKPEEVLLGKEDDSKEQEEFQKRKDAILNALKKGF